MLTDRPCFWCRNECLLEQTKFTMSNSIHLPTSLHRNENWLCQEKHGNKLNAGEKGLLKKQGCKIRTDVVKS